MAEVSVVNLLQCMPMNKVAINMGVLYFQAGIPGLGERRRKKLSPRQLQQMNLAQTQVLYNDLQTQIESEFLHNVTLNSHRSQSVFILVDGSLPQLFMLLFRSYT